MEPFSATELEKKNSTSFGRNTPLQSPEPIEYCEFCGDVFTDDHDCSLGAGDNLLIVEEENLAGTILDGRYEIIEMLGQGGMARVYRAIDHRLPKEVAIKILLDKLLVDNESLRRFQAEALAVSKLSHPNVISISDFGGFEGRPYYVMELIQGRTLAQVIKEEGTLSDERFVNVFAQLCMGLAHAHNRGVVHRDLKPSNILIYAKGDEDLVKLVDFGIAKVLTSPTQGARIPQKITATGVIIGSPLYMSPEQCRGACDSRSDIYSLGCTMFECLTGRPPFKGRSAIATMHMQMHEAAPSMRAFDESIPKYIEDIVSKTLEKDPAARFQNTDELEEALESIPVSPPSNTFEAIKAHLSESQVVQAISRRTRRNKKLKTLKLPLLLACTGLLGVSVIAAVYLMTQQQEPDQVELLSSQWTDLVPHVDSMISSASNASAMKAIASKLPPDAEEQFQLRLLQTKILDENSAPNIDSCFAKFKEFVKGKRVLTQFTARAALRDHLFKMQTKEIANKKADLKALNIKILEKYRNFPGATSTEVGCLCIALGDNVRMTLNQIQTAERAYDYGVRLLAYPKFSPLAKPAPTKLADKALDPRNNAVYGALVLRTAIVAHVKHDAALTKRNIDLAYELSSNAHDWLTMFESRIWKAAFEQQKGHLEEALKINLAAREILKKVPNCAPHMMRVGLSIVFLEIQLSRFEEAQRDIDSLKFIASEQGDKASLTQLQTAINEGRVARHR